MSLGFKNLVALLDCSRNGSWPDNMCFEMDIKLYRHDLLTLSSNVGNLESNILVKSTFNTQRMGI